MGGLIQLTIQGQFDTYLTGNPQMSFFKTVYRRHTNFSRETITFNERSNVNSLKFSDSTPINFNIGRNADLIGDMYFRFDVPAIYSGEHRDPDNVPGGDNMNYPYEFKWVKNLGTSIINEAKMNLNGTDINTFSRDILNVLAELNYDDSKKKVYDEMIGNVEEMYNPIDKTTNNSFYGMIKTNGTNAVDGVQKTNELFYNVIKRTDDNVKSVQILHSKNTHHDNEEFKVLTNDSTDIETQLVKTNYNFSKKVTSGSLYYVNSIEKILDETTIPEIKTQTDLITNCTKSIEERTIRVPFNFLSCSRNKIYLPLIALQYSTLEVNMSLAGYSDLYTINKLLDIDSPNKDYRVYRVKASTEDSTEDFLNNNNFVENNRWNLNPQLEVDFYYLDTDERRRFAESNHSYLITQVRESERIENSNNFSTILKEFVNPVKELIIFSRRSDFENINLWSNYTNWIYENIDPISSQYVNDMRMYYDNISQNHIFFDKHIDNSQITDKLLLSKNLVKNLEIQFGTEIRETKKDVAFYNVLEAYRSYKRLINPGLMLYSFSLNPLDFQPSGSCNFSLINAFIPNLTLVKSSSDVNSLVNAKQTKYGTIDYKIKVIGISYNVLEIASGVAGTKFTY